MAVTVRSQRSGRQQRATSIGREPRLAVVPQRRRWPAVLGGALVVFMLVAMLGAAVFHTQLAQRQLRIDDLDREVRTERERFDELRRDRAVLRSPGRISTEAEALGMIRGETSRFIEVDPVDLARQLAAAGATDDDATRIIAETGPLDQFRDVKEASVGGR